MTEIKDENLPQQEAPGDLEAQRIQRELMMKREAEIAKQFIAGGIASPGLEENAKQYAPPIDPILQFFSYIHLPPVLQKYSQPFFEMATWITLNLPRNPERTVALRKLLEAKDAAVRSTLFK